MALFSGENTLEYLTFIGFVHFEFTFLPWTHITFLMNTCFDSTHVSSRPKRYMMDETDLETFANHRADY